MSTDTQQFSTRFPFVGKQIPGVQVCPLIPNNFQPISVRGQTKSQRSPCVSIDTQEFSRRCPFVDKQIPEKSSCVLLFPTIFQPISVHGKTNPRSPLVSIDPPQISSRFSFVGKQISGVQVCPLIPNNFPADFRSWANKIPADSRCVHRFHNISYVLQSRQNYPR